MSSNSNVNLVKLLKKVEQQNPENALLAELYKRHGKNDVESLVTDLRQDASNTIGRIFTGAVDYDECVKRVAIKIGVQENYLTDNEIQNEFLILQKVLSTAYEKMSPEEREEKFAVLNKEFGDKINEDILKQILKGSTSALLTALQLAGPYILEGIFWRIVIYTGSTVALSAARYALLAVPFLNAIMGAWLVFDISGPAYRKIVPSVLNIAVLRLQDLSEQQRKSLDGTL